MNDGGPAFPVPPNEQEQLQDGWARCPRGMSLRDWFAGMAMQGLVASRFYDRYKGHGKSVVPIADIAAAIAGEYADAMIAERAKEKKEGALAKTKGADHKAGART